MNARLPRTVAVLILARFIAGRLGVADEYQRGWDRYILDGTVDAIAYLRQALARWDEQYGTT